MKKSGEKEQVSAGNESSSQQVANNPKINAANIESSVEVSQHQNSNENNTYLSKDKKRVQKARITADFVRKLPEGITYHEFDSSGDDEPQQVSDLGGEDDDEAYKEGDIVRVGKFRINIEKVTKQQLIAMRKYLPATQYRLIKNRKTARLCRRKRKEERGDMQRTLDDLR